MVNNIYVTSVIYCDENTQGFTYLATSGGFCLLAARAPACLAVMAVRRGYCVCVGARRETSCTSTYDSLDEVYVYVRSNILSIICLRRCVICVGMYNERCHLSAHGPTPSL